MPMRSPSSGPLGDPSLTTEIISVSKFAGVYGKTQQRVSLQEYVLPPAQTNQDQRR